jgi:ketosteroid isomerase-like protein
MAEARLVASPSMAREDVELVRRGFELWAQGGHEAAQEFLRARLAPDFEYIPHMAQIEGKVYKGPEALATWVSDMLEAFEEVRPEAEEFRDLGEHVMVNGRTTLRGKGSGVPTEFKWVQLYAFRDRLMTSCHIYPDEQSALAALGLQS